MNPWSNLAGVSKRAFGASCTTSVVCLGIVLATGTVSQSALVYDAAADFSIASNPNSTWSYGYSDTLGGTFTLYTTSAATFLTNSNFDAWFATGAQTTVDMHPFVAKNRAATIEQGAGLRLPPGGLGLHSGPDSTNEYSIVRWTAPSTGSYSISAAFTDRDFTDLMFGRGATTDVHVLLNSVAQYSAIINKDGWGDGPAGYLDVLSLTMGDTLDFGVGRGTNDTIQFDSTGLVAMITPVPEPSAFLLLGLIASVGMGFALGSKVLGTGSRRMTLVARRV